MYAKCRPSASKSNLPRRQRGLSLIELLAFIVIVGVGLAGILSVLNITLRTSADPLIQKQQLAVAESLLEEIQSKPFTFCDPNDTLAETAPNAASCSAATAITPSPAAESRFDHTNPFDNVADYNGLSMTGILNPATGTPIDKLNNYNATVTITPAGAEFGLAADEALRIDVTVTAVASGLPALTLTGYRFRYAPTGF